MSGFRELDSSEATDSVGSQQTPAQDIEDLLGGPPERLGQDPDEQQGRDDDDAGQSRSDRDDDDDLDLEGLDFDEDFQDDDDDGQGPDLNAIHTVKVNGQEKKVSLKEALEGYQRFSDYTAKTQQLAEERNTLNTERQAVAQEREQYSLLVQAVGAKLQELQGEEPDWEAMASNDPAEYVRKREAWNKRQRQLEAARQEHERMRREGLQATQQQMREFVRAEYGKLLEAKPELKEPEKARAFQSAINGYAQSEYGFTEQELANVFDHRLLLLAEKAMKYDRLVAKGKQRGKQVSSRPPLKPGVPRQESRAKVNRRKANARLRKSGSIRDAANAIETLLD